MLNKYPLVIISVLLLCLFIQCKSSQDNISLTITGPCDDALFDSLHKRLTPYIKSKSITDSEIVVNFKFKDDCCQEFGGRYTINQDSLIFAFKQTNNESCSCICWYRYKLKITDFTAPVKYVIVRASH